MNMKKEELVNTIEEYVCICEEMRELTRRHNLLKKRGIELIELLEKLYKEAKRIKSQKK